MPLPTLFIPGSLVSADPDLKSVRPIDHIKAWFKTRSSVKPNNPTDRILVLKSDTGSGKSTALPAVLFETFFKPGSGGIACAQPRVLNAISIVRDLVSSGHYKSLKLGKNIGWMTGPSKRESGIGLIYMTIGVLSMQLRTMSDDDIIAKYRFIIVDEVHESTLEQMSLLYMLRNFARRNMYRVQMPFIILTSATFDAVKFLNYFDCPGEISVNPSFISVAGFTYPLDKRFKIDNTVADYMLVAAQTAVGLHLENPKDDANRDILIFLPGTMEIERCREFLEAELVKLNADNKPLYKILSVVSEAVSSNTTEYSDVFAKLHRLRVTIGDTQQPIFRRIILSTNVAETGVTIPTLKYVIDSGLTKKPIYNPLAGTTALVTCAATKSMVRQRMGRANRVAPGVFVPLYPLWIFEDLDDMPESAVTQTNVGAVILSLLYEHMRVTISNVARPELANDYTLVPEALQTIDPIPRDQMRTVLERLYALGFISPVSTLDTAAIILESSWQLDRQIVLGKRSTERPRYNLTKMGIIAAGFHNIQPEFTRVILASATHGICAADLVTAVTFILTDISIDEKIKKSITGGIIVDDWTFPLLLWLKLCQPLKENSLTLWCREQGLKPQAIIAWLTSREELLESMLGQGLRIDQGEILDQTTDQTVYFPKIKLCVRDGFRMNVATLMPDGSGYKTLRGLKIKKLSFDPPPYSFIYTGITLKAVPGKPEYKAAAVGVAIIDAVDVNFLDKIY